MERLGEDLIFDGGFSTQLVADGHNVDGDPLWSARLLHTDPDAIVKVHKRYYEAGADVVISSSYQASLDGFKRHLGCTHQDAIALIKFSAALVKKACNEFWKECISNNREYWKKPLTCASLGPYGACLADGSEYTGSYIESISEEDLISWHDHRLSILAEEGLDLYIFETIPALAEAKAAMKLIEKYPDLAFAVSFSCKDEQRLSHGEALTEAVQLLNASPQIVAVGINCTAPRHVSGLLKSIQGLTTKKILVKPNSGAEWREDKSWSLVPRENRNISQYVEEWRSLGANWIGGCCTVGPSEISKIRKLLKKS